MENENPKFDHLVGKANALNSMRKQRAFTDFVLICDDDDGQDFSYPVHKAVLASCSKYFCDFFHENPEEKSLRLNAFSHLSNKLPKDILEMLLEFIYTGELVISKDIELRTVLVTASGLRLHVAVRICIQEIMKTIDNDNIIQYMNLTDEYHIEEMKPALLKHLQRNFKNLVNSNSFNELPFEYLEEVFSQNMPNYSSDEVFGAILKWIDFDKVAREQMGCKLLNFIDVAQMSVECLEKISENPVVRKNNSLMQKLLKETFTRIKCAGVSEPEESNVSYKLEGGSPEEIKISENTASCTSLTNSIAQNFPHNLYSYPNPNRILKSKFLCFVEDGEKWSSFIYDIGKGTKEPFIDPITVTLNGEEVPFPYRAAVCVHGDHVYFMGGTDLRDPLKSVGTTIALDIRTKLWERKADMNHARFCAECAIMGDNIYISGGFDDGFSRISKVECYNIPSNTWTYLPSLPSIGSNFKVCVYQNYLYAFQNFTESGSDNSFLKVQRYDPYLKQWSDVIEAFPLKNNFLLFTTVAAAGSIFVFTESFNTSICYEYYPTSGRWFERKWPYKIKISIAYIGQYSDCICVVSTDGRYVLLSLEDMEITKKGRINFPGCLIHVIQC